MHVAGVSAAAKQKRQLSLQIKLTHTTNASVVQLTATNELRNILRNIS